MLNHLEIFPNRFYGIQDPEQVYKLADDAFYKEECVEYWLKRYPYLAARKDIFPGRDRNFKWVTIKSEGFEGYLGEGDIQFCCSTTLDNLYPYEKKAPRIVSPYRLQIGIHSDERNEEDIASSLNRVDPKTRKVMMRTLNTQYYIAKFGSGIVKVSTIPTGLAIPCYGEEEILCILPGGMRDLEVPSVSYISPITARDEEILTCSLNDLEEKIKIQRITKVLS